MATKPASKKLVPAASLSVEGGAPRAAAVVLIYATLIASAEAVASYLPGADGKYPSAEGVLLGMVIHIATLFALMGHAAIVTARGAKSLAGLLVALSAVPLIRIFSLSVPLFRFTIVQWLLIISLPLLVVSFSLMRVLGLSPAEVGLARPRLRAIPLQVMVALAGVPLGLVEYLILRPGQAWIPDLRLVSLLLGVLAITLSSGLAEELIFRGVLLRKAEEAVGSRGGVLTVTAVYAAMHIGFLSPVDLAYVFGVGLFFGVVVLRSRNLYGVIASHSLANVVLYLFAPFVLGR